MGGEGFNVQWSSQAHDSWFNQSWLWLNCNAMLLCSYVTIYLVLVYIYLSVCAVLCVSFLWSRQIFNQSNWFWELIKTMFLIWFWIKSAGNIVLTNQLCSILHSHIECTLHWSIESGIISAYIYSWALFDLICWASGLGFIVISAGVASCEVGLGWRDFCC